MNLSRSSGIELDASNNNNLRRLFFFNNMFNADKARDLLLPGWLKLSYPTSCTAPDNSMERFQDFMQQDFMHDHVCDISTFMDDPETMFHFLLVSLVTFTVMVRLVRYQLQSMKEAAKNSKGNNFDDSCSSMDFSSSNSLNIKSRNNNILEDTSKNENEDTEEESGSDDDNNNNNAPNNKKSRRRASVMNPVNQSFFLRFVFSWTTASFKKVQLGGGNGEKRMSRVQWRLRAMQVKFLSVFWLLRTSFWMSGPYFYAAYASKVIQGQPVTTSLISQISLVGYAAIAVVGPYLGKLSDQYGRKFGTLLAALLYAMGSVSTTMDHALWILFVGRAIGGVGTSLLSASPEAWLVSEFKRQQQQVIDSKRKQKDDQKDLISDQDVAVVADPSWLQETFGMAYAYDSVVAILAGQLAGWAAARRGPTGPFQVSPLFLILGGLLTALFWDENKASPAAGSEDNKGQKQQTIWDAVAVIRSDGRIAFLGGVQSLFEGAMYVFVMQWPPTMNRAIQQAFGKSAITPYGTTFSCFMACCMAGSTIFGIMSNKKKKGKTDTSLEASTIILLALACLSLVASTFTVGSFGSTVANTEDQQRHDFVRLWQLIASYFVFEACVGMYFPSIGTLRSKYLPDSHRSVIMTLFGVPLNIIVVTVFLFVHKLGNVGALAVAAIAVGLATACMVGLYVTERRRKHQVRQRFKKIIRKIQRSLSKIKLEQEMEWKRCRRNRESFPSFSGIFF